MAQNKRKMRRKIPILKIKAEPGADYSVIAKFPEIKQIVLEETIIAIKDGIEKHKTSISLFEIADSNYYIELNKDKWKSTLEHLINYYVKREEYNKCIEVRDLINKL